MTQIDSTHKALVIDDTDLFYANVGEEIMRDEFGYNSRSCGIDTKLSNVVINKELIEWADEVIFLNREAYNYAKQHLANSLSDKKIVILDVPQEPYYAYTDLFYTIKRQYSMENKT